MKRPQQHIIETKSKKEFERIIPDTWVARELSSDYGLDYLVEIFKENSSTGYLFFVQLKGTDEKIIDDTISYQLSVNNIEYWNSIINPILLVFYSSQSNKFWGLWTNELKDNISLKRSDQKKTTIQFTEKHLLTETFFNELESVFNNALPSKINVTYKGNSDNTMLLHQCLEKWLKYFFNNEIHFENNILPNTCTVEYNIIAPDSLTIQIKTKGKTLKLKPVKFSGSEDFLFLPDIEIDKIPKPLSECLLLFALSNCEKDIKQSIKVIQSTIDDYTGEYLTMEAIHFLTNIAVCHEAISELNELAKTLILSNRIDEFQILNISILNQHKNNALYKLYQSNLEFAVENISDISLKGIISYNLANSFRITDNYYSNKYYQNARKLEQDYKNRFYWWFEYAGVLFLSGHLKIAEAFYSKSHELNAEQNIPLIFGLIGDCKFFQGKFSESITLYKKLIEYEEKSDSFSYEFILKSIVANELVASGFDKLPIDKALSLRLIQDGLEEVQENEQEELFKKAVIANPLNGTAWFNYSISLNNKGDSEAALTATIATTCIQSWDSEAWCNSLLLALNANKFDLFTIIYGAAYNSIGSGLLNTFSQSILDQPHLSVEEKKERIKAFTEISKKITC